MKRFSLLFLFFLFPIVVFADTYLGNISPSTATNLSGINLTDSGGGYRYYLFGGDQSALNGVSFGTNAAFVTANECGYGDSFTGTAQTLYGNNISPAGGCPPDTTQGIWTVYETDTGSGHNATMTFTIGVGPAIPGATSTVDQTQNNIFYSFILGLWSMGFVVYFFRKKYA